jgi:hypothetical protein
VVIEWQRGGNEEKQVGYEETKEEMKVGSAEKKVCSSVFYSIRRQPAALAAGFLAARLDSSSSSTSSRRRLPCQHGKGKARIVQPYKPISILRRVSPMLLQPLPVVDTEKQLQPAVAYKSLPRVHILLEWET